MVRRLFRIAAAALIVAVAVPQPSLAHDRWRHTYRPYGIYPRYWHGGHWVHGWHMGHDGWWWVIGTAWYFYPAPVYPYPEPPLVVVTPPPPPLIPPQYYYYCPNPPGYYPGLPGCPIGWQLVPAMPGPPPTPLPPPAVPPPGPAGGLDKSTAGTVLGAIGGGLAGAQMGHGSGKVAATAAGTLLGALIGHEVGASLDRADLLAASKAERTAYTAPLGQAIAWNNPESGHSGTITPLRDGQDSSGHYCRQFQQNIVIAGHSQQGYGTACRMPDGSWQVVPD